ncbi:hypothetical protein Sjap_006651 [Stephania japonica]|uniref:Uncharacterized protein n=1 Tax=Stephania japonica TaxID=461633 RepID=A0AAP0K7X2_9MAGN
MDLIFIWDRASFSVSSGISNSSPLTQMKIRFVLGDRIKSFSNFFDLSCNLALVLQITKTGDMYLIVVG